MPQLRLITRPPPSTVDGPACGRRWALPLGFEEADFPVCLAPGGLFSCRAAGHSHYALREGVVARKTVDRLIDAHPRATTLTLSLHDALNFTRGLDHPHLHRWDAEGCELYRRVRIRVEDRCPELM